MATATETPAQESTIPSMEEFTRGLAQAFDEKARTLTEAQAAPAKIAAAAATAETAAPESETPDHEEPKAEPEKPAAKAAVTKPTASKPVADLPAGGVKSAQWKEVKEEREKLRGRVTELETKLKEVESLSSRYADYEETKKKLEQYQATLREVAAERDPELVAPIISRINAAAAIVKQSIPADLQDEALALMKQPPTDARDEALSKILETLPILRQDRVRTAIREMESAMEERGQLAAKSQQAIERRQQAEQQRRQQMQQEFEQEMAEWTSESKGLEMLRTIPGNNEHNERARNIQESAKMLFGGSKLSTREFARAALWATTAPYLAEQNQSLVQQLAERDEIIAKLKATNPDIAGGTAGGDNGEAAPATKPEGMPLSQWLVQNAQREGVVFGPRG